MLQTILGILGSSALPSLSPLEVPGFISGSIARFVQPGSLFTFSLLAIAFVGLSFGPSCDVSESPISCVFWCVPLSVLSCSRSCKYCLLCRNVS